MTAWILAGICIVLIGVIILKDDEIKKTNEALKLANGNDTQARKENAQLRARLAARGSQAESLAQYQLDEALEENAQLRRELENEKRISAALFAQAKRAGIE